MIHIRHESSPELNHNTTIDKHTSIPSRKHDSPPWPELSLPSLPSLSTLLYHLHTIHLFTLSDLKTMLLPLTLFGLLTTLSGPTLLTPLHPSATPTLLSTLLHLPSLLLFLHPQILILSISNQLSPSSQLEDLTNKPWRPIVAGRISVPHARRLLLALVPATVAIGAHQGILPETLACLVGNWFYNDLGGADEHWALRNAVNGVAYVAYGSGAVKVLAGWGGGGVVLQGAFWGWLGVVCAVVGTTIQVQDLKDREGDGARGRGTMPVVLGEGWTRASVGVGVVVWSVVCTGYWGSGWGVTAGMVAAGGALGARVALWRDARADKASFVGWSVWVVGLFMLPLLSGKQG